MKHNINMLPEIGKTYKFYDDGKITYSRQYRCKIINVIPYDNVSDKIKEQYRTLVNHYNWIFSLHTDYFIIGKVEEDIIENQVFIRTLKGNWFSNAISLNTKDFDIIDRGDVGGILDVDGVITKELEQRYSK